MEEFEVALNLYNNTATGEDGIRFGMLEKNFYYTFSTTFFRMIYPCAGKINLTRLKYWVERYEILSATQYGFRNDRGTRACVALLLMAIQTSFEYKQQTLEYMIMCLLIKCIKHSCH
jgi:hypothetical protein